MADDPSTDDQYHYLTSSPAQWEKLKPLARAMRHAPTPAENALWQRLRNRRMGGARFRRQHSIAGFIVDFVCIEHALVIEVDGIVHEPDDRREYDAQRQAVLEAQGFTVLRFSNGDVLHALDAVVEVIGERLTSSRSGPGPGP
jgi:phosphoribosylformylglycinamidine synthase